MTDEQFEGIFNAGWNGALNASKTIVKLVAAGKLTVEEALAELDRQRQTIKVATD